MTRRLGALVVLASALAACEPEAWTDRAPKLAPVADGAPRLVAEAEFVVGRGGGFALAYDATGTWLASGGAHGDIVLHDARSMEVKARWNPYGNAVESLSFSPDGKYLLSGALWSGDDRPGRVYLWETATHAVVARFTGGSACAFAPDGSWFAYEVGGEVVVVDTATLAERRRIATGAVERIAIAPDGRRIAVSTDRVREFDLDGDVASDVLLDEGEPIYGLAYLPDGTLAAASRKGTVRIGARTVNVPKSVGALAVSADGGTIAVGESSGTVHLFAANARRMPETFRSAEGWVGGIAFAPGREWPTWIVDRGPLVLGSPRPVACLTWSGNESEVESVAFTTDGRFAAAGGLETVVFDLETKTGRADRGAPAAGFVAPAPSRAPSRSAFVRIADATILSVDAASGDAECVATDAAPDERRIEGAWMSPDGTRTIVSRWDTTRLVRRDGASEKPFGDFGRIFDGAWSADGRRFCGALLYAQMCGNGGRSPNEAVILEFDERGAVARRVPIDADPESLDLSPSGRLLALATAKGVQFRDAATGASVETIPLVTEWFRFVTDDAALVGTAKGIALWRRGATELAPLLEGATRGTLSPSRDRLAVTDVGRVFVYRIVR